MLQIFLISFIWFCVLFTSYEPSTIDSPQKEEILSEGAILPLPEEIKTEEPLQEREPDLPEIAKEPVLEMVEQPVSEETPPPIPNTSVEENAPLPSDKENWEELDLPAVKPLSEHRKVRALHLTFHEGFRDEVMSIGQALQFEVTTWLIGELPPFSFDPLSEGAILYNMGQKRAQRIWEAHKEFFLSFDFIIISDTTPLARIFLENQAEIPLVIWVCSRFDYADLATLDSSFPKDGYYPLINQATKNPLVTIFCSNPYEAHYALTKQVNLGKKIIQPCNILGTPSLTPSGQFLIPLEHNSTLFMDLPSLCQEEKIPITTQTQNHKEDFQGVIHLPFCFSSTELFSDMQRGIPHIIPSKDFFLKLLHSPNYWHQNGFVFDQKNGFRFSDWYNGQYQDILIYFDSWEDLALKIKKTDFETLKESVRKRGILHRHEMLSQWREAIAPLLTLDESLPPGTSNENTPLQESVS